MRFLVATVLLTGLGVVRAEPAPDLSLDWQEGEISLDMSLYRTTVTLVGTKVHYERTYSGREPAALHKPKRGDAIVKDPKKLAAALAAFDKAKVKPRPKDEQAYSGYQVTGCATRGKQSRCVIRRGGETETDEFKAITALRDVLLEGVPSGDLYGL